MNTYTRAYTNLTWNRVGCKLKKIFLKKTNGWSASSIFFKLKYITENRPAIYLFQRKQAFIYLRHVCNFIKIIFFFLFGFLNKEIKIFNN